MRIDAAAEAVLEQAAGLLEPLEPWNTDVNMVFQLDGSPSDIAARDLHEHHRGTVLTLMGAMSDFLIAHPALLSVLDPGYTTDIELHVHKGVLVLSLAVEANEAHKATAFLGARRRGHDTTDMPGIPEILGGLARRLQHREHVLIWDHGVSHHTRMDFMQQAPGIQDLVASLRPGSYMDNFPLYLVRMGNIALVANIFGHVAWMAV